MRLVSSPVVLLCLLCFPTLHRLESLIYELNYIIANVFEWLAFPIHLLRNFSQRFNVQSLQLRYSFLKNWEMAEILYSVHHAVLPTLHKILNATLFSQRIRIKEQNIVLILPIEVEQSILEDLRNRVQLSSVAPPSVSFYMFLNTHNGLSCSSISHDGSLVAGGFSDSVLKIFSGYGICQSLDNRLSIKGERRKNILEFSRAFLVILVGSPFFPFLSSQVGGEDYVRAIFLGLWGSVNLLSSFLCSILSVQAPQVAAAVCDFLHASLSSSSLGIHYCNGVVLVMWSIICQCFTR